MAVITISRQSGSEGNEITRLLCERLGYKLFDKSMMAKVAAEMGLQPEKIVDASASTHHAKSLIERWFGNYQSPFGDAGGWTISAQLDAMEAVSVQQVTDLLLAAYEKGNVVVLGRGGQVALAGKPDVLHVRIVAPLQTRIRRWQAREGLTYEVAHKKVVERDQAHADFVRRFFNADIQDPALYDLVINTEKLTPEAAVELIVKALSYLPA